VREKLRLTVAFNQKQDDVDEAFARDRRMFEVESPDGG